MKNIFSATEPQPEVDPAFHNQPQRGEQPIAPACNPQLPASAPVPLPPTIELIAEHAAPGSAHKADPITGR